MTMFWHSFVAYTRKIDWDMLKPKYFGLENCGQAILRKKICLKILSFWNFEQIFKISRKKTRWNKTKMKGEGNNYLRNLIHEDIILRPLKFKEVWICMHHATKKTYYFRFFNSYFLQRTIRDIKMVN